MKNYTNKLKICNKIEKKAKLKSINNNNKSTNMLKIWNFKKRI